MVVKMANPEGTGKRAVLVAGIVSRFVREGCYIYHDFSCELKASHATLLPSMPVENEVQCREGRDVQKSLQPTASSRFRDPES